MEILLETKECQLYREDHDTFEGFCRKELGMGRSNINRCIRSAEVAQNLSTIVFRSTREAHIHPLLKLPDADKQVACYRQALAVAEAEDRPLKASDVASAVRAAIQPETSRPTVPVRPALVDLLKAISRAVTKELERDTPSSANMTSTGICSYVIEYPSRSTCRRLFPCDQLLCSILLVQQRLICSTPAVSRTHLAAFNAG